MMLQLNPPLPLVTPRGKGIAVLVQDHGPEHDLEWTVLQDSGEVWTWRNPDVRAQENVTAGREASLPPMARPRDQAGNVIDIEGRPVRRLLGSGQPVGTLDQDDQMRPHMRLMVANVEVFIFREWLERAVAAFKAPSPR